jgi:hypothetical protein
MTRIKAKSANGMNMGVGSALQQNPALIRAYSRSLPFIRVIRVLLYAFAFGNKSSILAF